MKLASLLLAPLVLAAAAAPAQAPAPRPERGVPLVRLGETARIHGLRVTPLRVIEDSRCPQNARCVWAGRVRISVRVGGRVRELTLRQSVPVANGAVSLVAVLPERTTREGTIPPRAYRFGFEHRRGAGLELVKDRR
jgi:hypothetical protein